MKWLLMNENLKLMIETLNNASFKDIDEQFVLDKKEYDDLVEDLSSLDKSSISSKEKGDRLEKILFNILTNSGLFKVTANKRTSTNEIDVRAEKTSKLAYIENHYTFNIENVIYFECKNYSNKLGVTYIGKFFSILQVANIKIGVIISPLGLTGKGWYDGHGLCKKLYLKNDINIISITKEDLLRLDKVSLLYIMQQKIHELQEDMDLEECFNQTHELVKNGSIVKEK
ncbi:restriction endonuclease [Staphylococcus epidermidis]|uniref:restriction endonuclease n=2 Tax=Staphylococcus epidermidis TaxID=1282 RepID=UPI001F4225A7|nr:restriction endonuclease [Staphylococcus epidermidis]